MRVAVIGAGPAGMTAALELCRGGADVVVYEADERVGGLARSFDLWDQRVDLGPHRFFSTDSRINRLWLSVVGRDYVMVNRLTRIYYQKKFYHYPLQPANALKNMGLANAFRCVGSYLKEKVRPRGAGADRGTFEGWVVDRFGRRLFEMFFKSYSEKLWGISCQELDADFAAQRIKKFSLKEAVFSAFSLGGRSKHKTLVDCFAYPKQGAGMAYENMADEIRSLGGKIHFRSPVRRVVREGSQVTGLELADGTIVACDHVISTMPLTLMVRGLGDTPAEVQTAIDALKFRNTIIVYLNVDAENLFPDQWLYIHSPDLLMGRVTNFRNWTKELYRDQKSSILAIEYWCYENDDLWKEDDAVLIERATREMRSTGLIGDARVLEGRVIRIPRCYPVYARGYREHVETVVKYLKQFRGLTPIGRYGAFKYNNQDHSILMGLLAAENILKGASHDLWAVNTDYDSYQEKSQITEVGLVEA